MEDKWLRLVVLNCIYLSHSLGPTWLFCDTSFVMLCEVLVKKKCSICCRCSQRKYSQLIIVLDINDKTVTTVTVTFNHPWPPPTTSCSVWSLWWWVVCVLHEMQETILDTFIFSVGYRPISKFGLFLKWSYGSWYELSTMWLGIGSYAILISNLPFEPGNEWNRTW